MSHADSFDSGQDRPSPTMEETMEAVFDKLNAAPTEEPAEETPGPSDMDRPVSPDTVAGDADAASRETTDAPPATWSAEEKAEFNTLSKGVARAVLRREKDRERAFQGKSEEIAEQRRRYQALDAAIEPHRSSFSRQGMGDIDAVRALVAAHEWLEREPRAALAWLGQRYGAGLASDTPPASMPTGATNFQPVVAWGQADLQHGHAVSSTAANAPNWPAEISGALKAFSAETGASGKPAHPHYAEVVADMMPIIQSAIRRSPGQPYAELVAEAYENAVWSRRDLRSRALDDARREGHLDAEAESRQRAGKARKASAVNLPDRGLPTRRGVRGQSMEETMARVYDQLNGT